MKNVFIGAAVLAMSGSLLAGPVTPESGKDLSPDIMSTGWAKNKAIGLEYHTITQDNKENGTKSGETDSSHVHPFAMWSNDNFSIELAYRPVRQREKPISDAMTRTDEDTYDFKGAYRFNSNVAALLGHNITITESPSNKTTIKTTAVGVSYNATTGLIAALSYNLGNMDENKKSDNLSGDINFSTMKIGLGYDKRTDADGYALDLYYETTSEKKKSLDASNSVVMPKSSTIAMEANYTVGPYDFDGGISLSNEENSVEQSKTETTGIFFDFEYAATENIYIAPGITSATGEITSSATTPATKSDVDSDEFRLALGYATDKWDLTGTVYQSKTKTSSATTTEEDKGTGFKINVGYLF